MKISIEDFTGECSCGQTHELAVNDVILEEGALQKIPQILKQEPYDAYHHLAMVCDGHRYEAAASVDGYVSTVAAMSWYGFKRSMIAKSPILVIADSRVIAEAPMRLTASGVGDLLGKNTALADWKITHILNGEHICRRICDMEYEALNNLK